MITIQQKKQGFILPRLLSPKSGDSLICWSCHELQFWGCIPLFFQVMGDRQSQVLRRITNLIPGRDIDKPRASELRFQRENKN